MPRIPKCSEKLAQGLHHHCGPIMTIKGTGPTYSCLSHIVDTKQNGGMEGDMEYMVCLLKPEPTKAKTNLQIGEVLILLTTPWLSPSYT